MTTITAIITRDNGTYPTELQRVPAGTPKAEKFPVWTGAKYRTPKMGERVGVYVDGRTPYAIAPRN